MENWSGMMENNQVRVQRCKSTDLWYRKVHHWRPSQGLMLKVDAHGFILSTTHFDHTSFLLLKKHCTIIPWSAFPLVRFSIVNDVEISGDIILKIWVSYDIIIRFWSCHCFPPIFRFGQDLYCCSLDVQFLSMVSKKQDYIYGPNKAPRSPAGRSLF